MNKTIASCFRMWAACCWLVCYSASASLISFQPTGSLAFNDVYLGTPHSYVDVAGSATGGGTWSLNQASDGFLTITYQLIIGPQSVGMIGLESRLINLSGLTPGVAFTIPGVTVSADAPTFLPDENSAIPVSVNFQVGYEVYSLSLHSVVEGPTFSVVASKTVYVQSVPDSGSTGVMLAVSSLFMVLLSYMKGFRQRLPSGN